MTEIQDLLVLLEDNIDLLELRVTRSKRTPARVRQKRKRYYRRHKSQIKRRSKRYRRKPRVKRLAKRRAKIRKRLHLKPGSRRRIHMSMDTKSNLREGAAMTDEMSQLKEFFSGTEKKDLINAFKNAAKLAEHLSTNFAPVLESKLIKSKPLNPPTVKTEDKEIPEEMFDSDPLSLLPTDEVTAPLAFSNRLDATQLDEDFDAMIREKVFTPVKKKEVSPVKECVQGISSDLKQMIEDANRLGDYVKSGAIDENDAGAILKKMVEYLTRLTEMTEDDEDEDDEKGFATIYLDRDPSHEVLDIISKDLKDNAPNWGEFEIAGGDNFVNLHGIHSASNFEYMEDAVAHVVDVLKATGYKIKEIPSFPQLESKELKSESKKVDAKVLTEAAAFSKLKPEHKKAVKLALQQLKDDGYENIVKKIESGQWNLKKAGEWAEDLNYHGLASIFRNEKGADHSVIMKGEVAHRNADGEAGEAYPGERDDALAAKYDASHGSASKEGREYDEKHLSDRMSGDSIKLRKLRTLKFLHYHELQDTETFKQLMKHIKDHKADYKAFYKEILANQQKNHDEIDGEESYTPEEKKDLKDYYSGQIAKLKEVGKKYGLDESDKTKKEDLSLGTTPVDQAPFTQSSGALNMSKEVGEADDDEAYSDLADHMLSEAKPPQSWWCKTYLKLKKSNPESTEEELGDMIADMWKEMSDEDKKELMEPEPKAEVEPEVTESVEKKKLGESVRLKWNELPNGDLEVKLANPSDADHIDDGEDFEETFEYLLANGLDSITPEESGALTDSPIIGDVSRDDNGEIKEIHSAWYFPDYMTVDPSDVLRREGKVVFKNAKAEVKTESLKPTLGWWKKTFESVKKANPFLSASALTEAVARTWENMDQPIGSPGAEGMRMKYGMAEEPSRDNPFTRASNKRWSDFRAKYPQAARAIKAELDPGTEFNQILVLNQDGKMIIFVETPGHGYYYDEKGKYIGEEDGGIEEPGYPKRPDHRTGVVDLFESNQQLTEADPSLAPPKKWFKKMYKQVKGGNPGYDDDKIKNTIGDIWYHKLSTGKKKEIRGSEGKEHGKAESIDVTAEADRTAKKKLPSDDEMMQAMQFLKDAGLVPTGTGKPTLPKRSADHTVVWDKDEEKYFLIVDLGNEGSLWSVEPNGKSEFVTNFKGKFHPGKNQDEYGEGEYHDYVELPVIQAINDIVDPDWNKPGEGEEEELTNSMGESDDFVKVKTTTPGYAARIGDYLKQEAINHKVENNSDGSCCVFVHKDDMGKAKAWFDKNGGTMESDIHADMVSSTPGANTFGRLGQSKDSEAKDEDVDYSNCTAIILNPGMEMSPQEMAQLSRTLGVKVQGLRGENHNIVKIETTNNNTIEQAKEIIGDSNIETVKSGKEFHPEDPVAELNK